LIFKHYHFYSENSQILKILIQTEKEGEKEVKMILTKHFVFIHLDYAYWRQI